MGPSVRNLLSQYRLDAGSISSTGPHNVVLKGDVLDYITRYNLQPIKGQNRDSSTNASGSSTITYVRKVDRRDNSKYARKFPTPQEIEVINAGGVFE